ncbi:MAG: hypothetical protein QOF43_1474 [Gaiellaceae bacterium]|nr:hypothetical protein [Gaiellaceae bacterium]
MKLSYLIRGLPGHPLHPPLTDATIGIYTFATIAAIFDAFGWSSTTAAHGWWLALLVGLASTVATALTGFADWLTITRGTELWKTATSHMVAMLTATVFFALAAAFGHGNWESGNVHGFPLAMTLIGFVVLTLGGWLGGAIVYTHGMRVLNLVDEPVGRAVSPVPKPEKEQAEG